MAFGIPHQPRCRRDEALIVTGWGRQPWRMIRHSNRVGRTFVHRRERRRAKSNPECWPEYRRYYGYS